MVVAEKRLTHYTLQDNDLVIGENTSLYVLKVRDLPFQEKPREKLCAYGPTNLSLAEVVAVLLGVGSKKEEVMHMSQRIIKEYGERAIAHETSPSRMAEILDIPVYKACQLVAGFELGRRFYATKAGKPVFIRTTDQAFEHLKSMRDLPKEQLRGLYLNSRYELVHEEVISVGSLTANIVHPREVFRPAIEHGAAGVIIAHNHPSGDASPTEADFVVTSQVQTAGTVMGIDLLDHLIITKNEHRSIIGNP